MMIARRKAHLLPGEFGKAFSAYGRKARQFDPCLRAWKEAIKQYLGVSYALPTGSGRFGLQLILKALGLKSGEEVIIPAYTLYDLVGVMESLGLKAVPADIDRKTFNLSPESVASRINGRTKAILATHLFGAPCDIAKIIEIAKKKQVFVIEDCAHAAGAEIHGRKAGSLGDASFFSFETMKPINTYGGGMVASNSESIFRNLFPGSEACVSEESIPVRKMINLFCEDNFLATPLAYPALFMLASRRWNTYCSGFYRRLQKAQADNNYSGFQAHLGLEKIKTLDERVRKRNKLALVMAGGLDKRIKPQEIIGGALSNYYFFVALVPSDPWAVRKKLLMRGIDAGIFSEIADDCASLMGYRDCPNAGYVFNHAIQLPLYEFLSDDEIRFISDAVSRIA